MKRFDEWNKLKKELHSSKEKVIFKERDVFWVSIGENIGFEQNGKGNIFSRPVLVMKKFSKNMFFGIPLSTQTKEGNYFYNFDFLGERSNALIVQGRLFDSKRLENKIGMIDKKNFESIKIKLKELLNV
ncbi:MAG: type II toxin-antitoxin system PemK/MazF family toxin [Campylobacterales bacterium]|nr:type II toxin-antitoxin system PemK/MazF family toxin [Campylobacterales bacterium]